MLSASGARNIRAVTVRKKIQSKSATMDPREESCNDETDEQNSDDVFQRSKPSHRHRRTSSFETIRVGMGEIKQKGRVGVNAVKQSARNIRVAKVRKERSDHRKESDEQEEQQSNDVFQRSKPRHRHRRTSSFETIRVGMGEIKQKGRAGVDTVKQKGRAGVDTVRATIKKKTPTSLPTRSLFVHTPRTWYGSKIKVPKDKDDWRNSRPAPTNVYKQSWTHGSD